jgi:hypothetical protein
MKPLENKTPIHAGLAITACNWLRFIRCTLPTYTAFVNSALHFFARKFSEFSFSARSDSNDLTWRARFAGQEKLQREAREINANHIACPHSTDFACLAWFALKLDWPPHFLLPNCPASG